MDLRKHELIFFLCPRKLCRRTEAKMVIMRCQILTIDISNEKALIIDFEKWTCKYIYFFTLLTIVLFKK